MLQNDLPQRRAIGWHKDLDETPQRDQRVREFATQFHIATQSRILVVSYPVGGLYKVLVPTMCATRKVVQELAILVAIRVGHFMSTT